MQIFAGDRGSGNMGRQTRKWSSKMPQCCHAFTLASARLSCKINDSEHYFDTTVGFLGQENIGLANLFKFLS